MAQDSAALRRRLRVELRRARNASKLTQREVAEALDWSPSKLIRIESGQVAISTTDLRALLQHYGVKDKRLIDQLVEMARNSKKQPFSQYRDIYSPEALTFFAYQASASIIRQVEPVFIPGILQTEDYMRAVLKDVYQRSGDTLERLVESRLERQEILERPDPPQSFFILSEGAIRQQVGGRGAMRRQLEHLEELNKRPNVSIQVLPFAVGAHAGMKGPAVILEFEDPTLDDLLYLEGPRGDFVTRDEPGETASYLNTFWELENQATDKAEFSQLVADASANAEPEPKNA